MSEAHIYIYILNIKSILGSFSNIAKNCHLSSSRWPFHAQDLLYPFEVFALSQLVKIALVEKLFMLVTQLVADVADDLRISFGKPLDVAQIVIALSGIEAFQLIPHHRRDIMHRKLLACDAEVFYPCVGVASGAAEATYASVVLAIV